MRILIVDDNQAFIEALGLFLKKNFEVSSINLATSAAEALDLCAKNDYDICFIDYLLEDDDGVNLSLKIKKLLPFTLIAIISALEEPSSLVDKPFSAWINKSKSHEFLPEFIRKFQIQQILKKGGEKVES